MLKALSSVCAALSLTAMASSEDRELTFHSGIEFAETYEKQVAHGFRPIDMAMFTEKQTARLVVVWGKQRQSEFHVRVGFATAKFEGDSRQLISEGSCPLDLTVTSVNGMGYYSCVWDVAGEPRRELERGLTQTQIARTIAKRAKDGFRIRQVCGYAIGRADRYACVWENSEGPKREVTILQTQAGLVPGLKRMQAKGLQPGRISVYPAGGQMRFAVVWEEE